VYPNFFILINTQEDIFKNVGNQTGTVDGDMLFFFSIWKSMGPINCLVTDIFQNVFFCSKSNRFV